MDKPVWWEKTVEYAFVVQAAKTDQIDFAAPLSGKHETTAADAIFSVSSKVVLIEFKRDKSCIPTEMSMFIDYNNAQGQLKGYGHHHIVYAEPTDTHPIELKLKAEKYFDQGNAQNALGCLKTGVDQKEFDDYLVKLAEHKKESKQGSGGHISPEAFASVVGVSDEGNMCAITPLHEYAPTLFPRPEPRVDYTLPSNDMSLKS